MRSGAASFAPSEAPRPKPKPPPMLTAEQRARLLEREVIRGDAELRDDDAASSAARRARTRRRTRSESASRCALARSRAASCAVFVVLNSATAARRRSVAARCAGPRFQRVVEQLEADSRAARDRELRSERAVRVALEQRIDAQVHDLRVGARRRIARVPRHLAVHDEHEVGLAEQLRAGMPQVERVARGQIDAARVRLRDRNRVALGELREHGDRAASRGPNSTSGSTGTRRRRSSPPTCRCAARSAAVPRARSAAAASCCPCADSRAPRAAA